MGNSLILLTYHTSDMGTDPDFFTDAIEGRVKNYYDFAMGGAAVNGIDNTASVNTYTADYLKANPVGTAATFTVVSKTLNPERVSAEITVTVTAKEALPEGIRLHAAVVETQVDVVALYGEPTKNGQTIIPYVVRELITGSEGTLLPAMAINATQSFTNTFERDPNIQNADSLRVTTWIQNESTKDILAADATTTSAIPEQTSIFHISNAVKNTKQLVYSTGKGTFVIVLPYSDVTATIFNVNGRTLKQYRITGKEGQKVSLPHPRVQGILLLKLTSHKGETFIYRILCK